MKNPLVIKSLESKLPHYVKRDGLMFMVDPKNKVTPDNHFDMLLKFLKNQEEVLERLEQLRTVEKVSDHPERKYENVPQQEPQRKECWKMFVRCVAMEGIRTRFSSVRNSKEWSYLRRKLLWKIWEHAENAWDSMMMMDFAETFLCRNKDCRKGGGPSDHHYFLCPKGGLKKGHDEKSGKISRSKSKLTEEQEEFLSELSPELAEWCRKAFTNKTVVGKNTKDQSELLKSNGLAEIPVIIMLMEVTANAGQKIGTLVDLASDTNYIIHKAADRLRLKSEN